MLQIEPNHFILSTLTNRSYLQVPKKASTSYSSCLVNLRFQQTHSPFCSHISATHASLVVIIKNNARKASPKGTSLHHLSFQNFTPTILHLKSSSTVKNLPPASNCLSHPHLTPFPHSSRAPSPPSSSPYFLPYNHLIPKVFILNHKSLTPFIKKNLVENEQTSNTRSPTPFVHVNCQPIH